MVPILAAILIVGFPDNAPAQRATLEQTVDSTVAPGADFFAYANGAWLQVTSIPAGRDRWGARDEIAATTRAQVAAVLDAAAAAPRGTTARKLADYRSAFLDQAAIDARGVLPVRPLLRNIDAIRDRAALTRVLAQGMRADVDPLNWGIYRSASLLGLSVEPGINGERTNVAFLVQGGLGLSDRDDYLSADPAAQALRARYRTYVTNLFTLAGLDLPVTRAERVLALETAIARTQATKDASARDHNADSLWTRADFARRAPGFDWTAFFNAAGLGRQPTFVPWQPSAVEGVATLASSASLESWKDYLRFHVIHDRIDVLPSPFLAEFLTLSGMPATEAGSYRTGRAPEILQRAMGEGLGRLYVERYFPAAEKARVARIVRDVVSAFTRRVEASTWMTPTTQAIALAKVRSVNVGVGYPERWQDYSDLAIDPADAFGNRERAEARLYRLMVARIGRPVDRSEWWILPQMSGAILVFQQNAYDFAAALLQPPKYDPAASDAATYGAIGAIIGHDVSHVVDVLGAEYDTTGRMTRWWTAEDQARFDALAAPLVAQYSAYRPFPNVAIDGQRTRTENVADLTGLAAAFDAYRASLGSQAEDRAYVRRQDREFFIAYGQGWRSRLSDGALRAIASGNTHSPDRYRVATVRNLDAWYEAFDVKEGDALYLAPAARVRIW